MKATLAISAADAVGFGLDVGAKAAALVAVVALADRAILGRRRVPARATLWNACLLGLLLLPPAASLLPKWTVAWFPAPSREIAPVEVMAVIPESASPEIAPAPPAPEARTGPSPASIAAPVIPGPAPLVPRPAPVAAPPPPRPVDLAAVALGLYVAGALILMARLAGSLAAVARLVRSADGVDAPAWSEALGRWRATLGIRRGVDLRRSPRASIPAVVGGRRPTILLPPGMVDAADPGVIDAVLLHELCHVRRDDYAWNLVLRLVQVVYWPHPLAWLVGRPVADLRERACDELCVHHLAGSRPYRSVLIEVASALARRPGPSLGLAMARGSRLGRRLALIERSRGLARCTSPRTLRLMIGAAVLAPAALVGSIELARASAAPFPGPPKPAVTAPAPEPSKTWDFRAIDDATGRPLPGVTIRLYRGFEDLFLATDADGRAKLPRPRPGYHETVDFWKEGYVQERKMWSDINPPYKPIPDSLDARLKLGAGRIGGTIRDEDGKPVAGATLHLYESPPYRKAWKGMVTNLPVSSDAEGRWTTGSVPPETCPIHGEVDHPEFQFGRLDHSLDRLRAGKGDVVLKRGAIVEGRVLTDGGDPIAGASVVAEESRSNLEAPETRTGPDGRFRLANLAPGEGNLVIQADGRTPEMVHLLARRDGPPLEVRMRPGHRLRGRVVDASGAPVAEANVHAGTWKRDSELRWRGKTDAEGRFAWDSAPVDGVEMTVFKSGYEREVRTVNAIDKAETWTLRRSIRIHGSVTDAKTGGKIPRFVVDFAPDAFAANQKPKDLLIAGEGLIVPVVPWAYPLVGTNTQLWGRYEFARNEPAADFQIAILAEGYRPFLSRRFAPTESNVLHDVKLEKLTPGEGGGATGTVVGLDGKPLAGADVLMGTRAMRATLTDGAAHPAEGQMSWSGVGYVTTGEDGTFTFGGKPGSFHLAVVHETGFVEITNDDLARSPTVRVRPWGRIEGRAAPTVGRDPAIKATVWTDGPPLDGFPPFNASYENVRIDEDGRFTVERVTPGPMRVELSRLSSRGFDRIGAAVRVDVQGGETTRVVMDATGRTVEGRFGAAAGEAFDPSRLVVDGMPYSFRTARARVPIPGDLLKSGDRDGQKAWANAWLASAEGRAARLTYQAGHVIARPDGTFRVDGLIPGEYHLAIQFRAIDRPRGEVSAMASQTIRVPDGPAGSTVDVGTILVRRLGHPAIGAPAPPIVGKTLDGLPFRLEDVRGKVVVLRFWRSDDDRSRAEVFGLEDLKQAFGDEPKLAVVNLCLDPDPDAARRFVAEAGQGWTEVDLGDWPVTDIPAAYGVDQVPTTFILGPDGRLLWRCPWFIDFRAAVAGILGKP